MPGSALSNSASPLLTRSTDPILREFLLFLASERGLADNSVHAYRRDLEDLETWLASRSRRPHDGRREDLSLYLQDQTRKGQSTRTVARRLAAIRVFLRFLSAKQFDVAGALDQLERPKPEQSLPKILSRAQVNQLICAPNPKSFLFARDVAILELLYASGLRAANCAT